METMKMMIEDIYKRMQAQSRLLEEIKLHLVECHNEFVSLQVKLAGDGTCPELTMVGGEWNPTSNDGEDE